MLARELESRAHIELCPDHGPGRQHTTSFSTRGPVLDLTDLEITQLYCPKLLNSAVSYEAAGIFVVMVVGFLFVFWFFYQFCVFSALALN